jgi:hypothetical protein
MTLNANGECYYSESLLSIAYYSGRHFSECHCAKCHFSECRCAAHAEDMYCVTML